MTDAELPPDPFGPTPLVPLRWSADGTAVVVDVEVVPLNIDGPEQAWCTPCLLPSAEAYRFRVLANGRPLPTELTLTICRDCGTLERSH